MEMVITQVFVPATGCELDVRFPRDFNAQEAAKMAAKAIEDLYGEGFRSSRSCVLAWRNTGELLNPAKTLAECGVVTSSRLIII